MLAAFFRRSRGAAIGGLLLGVAACGSEPLEGGGEGGGANGSAGEGGGANVPDIPDYTSSPCYGEPWMTSRYDGQAHRETPVATTCRGEGDRALVYVADDVFGTRVTQDAVNRFLHRYELAGSRRSFRPDLGVLPTNEAVFGALRASQTSDGKLPIVIIDTNGGGDGYLCGWCRRTELHLDAVQLTPLDGDKALAIAAHESFHAIHRGYDADEVVWVDETLAEAAMVVNGFGDEAWLNDFLDDPNVDWGPGITRPQDFHYGAGLAFGAYLWEQGGPELLSAITAERANGWSGIEAALAATGEARDALALFLDMAVALHVDDPAQGYGFESFQVGDRLARPALSLGSPERGRLEPYGLVYRTLPASATTLLVEGDASVRGRVVYAGEPPVVDAVRLDAETELSAGTAVLVLTATASAAYTVTAR